MKRKCLRLKNYDYSSEGYYFITICTHNRKMHFDQFPYLKYIVEQTWIHLPDRFPEIEMDEFIVMPNHIHGIIQIVGAGLAPALNNKAAVKAAPTIGEIIGTFKSLCIYRWLKYIESNNLQIIGRFWQRNYYEHIIRNSDDLNKIRKYILDNPTQWELDAENITDG